MNLIKKLGIIAIGAVLMAGCTPKSAVTQSSDSSTVSESSATESSKTESAAADTNKDMKKIGVIQLVEHKSLDIIYNSFKDELKELGYVDGENAKITFQNAQGDMANITSIVQGFEGDKQDVVVTIATPVAQGAMSLTKTTPNKETWNYRNWCSTHGRLYTEICSDTEQRQQHRIREFGYGII